MDRFRKAIMSAMGRKNSNGCRPASGKSNHKTPKAHNIQRNRINQVIADTVQSRTFRNTLW